MLKNKRNNKISINNTIKTLIKARKKQRMISGK